MKIIIDLSFAITMLALLTACGPISRTLSDDKIVGDISGMEKMETEDEYAVVYRLPGFQAENYTKFNIAPVRTIAVGNASSKISPEEKLELEKYLRDAVSKQLIEGGYSVVETSGPDVLGIRFTLTDIDSGNPYLNIIQFYGPGISLDVGGVSIETEFFDTLSYKPQAIAVIGADGARKFNMSSMDGNWGDVEQIFDDWAAGFRAFLDTNKKK